MIKKMIIETTPTYQGEKYARSSECSQSYKESLILDFRSKVSVLHKLWINSIIQTFSVLSYDINSTG